MPTFLNPTGLALIPEFYPDGRTVFRTPAEVEAYLRAGVRYIRLTLCSETFFADPDRQWPYVQAWIVSALAKAKLLARPLAIELVLASIKADPAESPHKQLVQGWQGKVQYAEGAMELVRRGVKAFGDKVSYQLTTEPVLDNPADYNDPHSALACDELNALLFSGLRTISKTARLVLSSPAWEHCSTLYKQQFGGDQLCGIAGHLYNPNPTGLVQDLAITPGQDLVGPMRTEVKVAVEAAARLGRQLWITEWGGLDLNVRNDWATTQTVQAQKQVLTEFGLWNRACYFLDSCLWSGGKQIALASPVAPAIQ